MLGTGRVPGDNQKKVRSPGRWPEIPYTKARPETQIRFQDHVHFLMQNHKVRRPVIHQQKSVLALRVQF